jgi:hypothetical protein
MKPELIRRKDATEATLARYRGKAFDWSKGITCVHLARCHMRKMGHTPPPMPRFRSAFAARQAMTERGWNTVSEMLDSILERIPPSRMLLGDLAVAPSDEGGMGSIMVCAGPHKLMGWREDAPELVMLDVTLDQLEGAWRL